MATFDRYNQVRK